MCLISKEETPSTSSYSIKCYKILIPEDGKLLTPFRNFVFPIGKVIVDKINKTPSEVFGIYMIEEGYFHAYKSLEATKNKVEEIKRYIPENKTIKIYHAEIPSNSEFYEGQLGDICSKALKIVSECYD